jgi:cysteine desulfurase
MEKKLLYFDNNGTTRTCDPARRLMESWIQSCSNPSGSSVLSVASQQMIQKFKEQIWKLCGIKPGDYEILITSGATESNCSILRMVEEACAKLKRKPHIIASSLEHKSILQCLQNLEEAKRIDYTLVNPNIYGVVDPEDIKAAIQPNTVLITVMYANNELGTLNPISKIAEVAHAAKIPFHTDAVQMFGKTPMQIGKMGLDAVTVSFHKLYGPPGIGLLIMRQSLIKGYGLQSIISGTQQGGLRGGTESTVLIAGAVGALLDTFSKRDQKNKHLKNLRKRFLEQLEKFCDVVSYCDLLAQTKAMEESKNNGRMRVCILGHPTDTMPNTVLLSFIPPAPQVFCNVKFKKLLEDKKIIVSIGSACNTTSKKASHVLDAIEAPPLIKRGVLRISFGDQNTMEEITKLTDALKKSLKELGEGTKSL